MDDTRLMMGLAVGASPFVENVSGVTPYEAAARRRDGLVSRELESHGRFSGFMLIKVLT